MIKDLIDNFVTQLQNEENQERVAVALEPWLFKVKLFCYVLILLLLVMSVTLSLIVFKLYSNPIRLSN